MKPKENNPANRAKFISGDVGKLILFGAIPMTLGIGASIGFNFVDTVFVAKLGVKQLAAITYTFPMVFLILGVAMGIGMGATAVISKVIGEDNEHRMKRLSTDAILLAALIALITITVCYLLIDPLFRAMGADNITMKYVYDYMNIWIPGNIFLIISVVGNYIIRATGDMKTPSYIIIAAGVINLILDPVFIFGLGPIPALGMQGAALATLLGRVVTFVVALRIMHNKYDMFTFEKITLKQLLSSWKEILQIGLPTVAGNVIVPIGFGVIIDFTAHYGSAAVAALGAASRVEAIMMTVFMATAAVLSPFIGQNWGARKFDRIDRALKIVFAFCLVWGAAMIGFFELFKEPISHFVKSDPAVVKVMVLYLGIAPFAMAFRGVLMISGSALTVLKKPYEAMGLTIAYMFIFFVPLAYYGSKYFGLSGIFWSLVVGAVITSIIAYFLLYSRYNKIKARDILRIDSDDDNDLEVAMAE